VSEPRERWPLVVVGAGAAGIFTALFAARAGVRTLLLETREKPGAKIRVSGGGRCNVLPSSVDADDFHTQGSRNALRLVLASWPLADVRAFFERDLGLPLKTEATGKVFPVSDDAREVVRALLGACERAGIVLRGGARVESIARANADGARFRLTLAHGEAVATRWLAIATGGLSLPKTGSDGFGYAAARALGHRVLPTYPALVPLVAAQPRWCELAGVSLVARVRASRGGATLEERTGDLLFTHRGFSGPVALDLSHHLTGPERGNVALEAAWLGRTTGEWEARLLAGGARTVESALRDDLPRRLSALLLDLAGVAPDRKLSELARAERKRLLRCLAECPLDVRGDEGYRVAEVTGGGVALDEVSPRTLESRIVPGLYFAGEVLDVTGRIGGFNFLWAWCTGRKVGIAVAQAARAELAP
jgi:hypothetical protein